MKKVKLNKRECLLKVIAIVVVAIFVLASSPRIVSFPIPTGDKYFNSSSQLKSKSKQIRRTQSIAPQVNAILSANGQTWEDLNTGSLPGTPAETYVSSSNMTGITVICNVNGFWKDNVSLNGTDYDTLDLPAAIPRSIEGQPQVPRLTYNLEVPHGVEITTEILSADLELVGGYNVVPAQISTISLNGSAPYAFVKNTTTYITSSHYPSYNYTTSGHHSSSPIMLRGRRILQVSMYPVQFNPLLEQLKAYTQFEIRINYDHAAEIEAVDAALYSEAFESLYERFLLNYMKWSSLSLILPTSTIPTTTTTSTTTPESLADKVYTTADYPTVYEAEYLIIAHNDFKIQAQRLADWKTRKGIFTNVILTSAIYPNEDTMEVFEYTHTKTELVNQRIQSLKTFIQNDVILDMNPVPTYILLFGDVSHIPCDYSITHTAWFPSNPPVEPPYLYHGDGEKGRIPTDVTYFCFEEDDYLPDIMHGRISVENEEEAGYVVDKILMYEQQPHDHDTFYNDILLSSYFDDYFHPGHPDEIRSDGVEDEPFISTMEQIYNELDPQYTFHKSYNYDTTVFPVTLHDGSATSSIAWHTNDRPWIADNTDVISNLIDGRFLVYHIDHGSSVNFWWNDWEPAPNRPDPRGQFDGWGAPDFRTTQFYQLKFINEENLGMYPLILSMDCMTGWFDGETDGLYDDYGLYDHDYSTTGVYDTERLTDSFAEKIVRIEKGGAIAAIAPSRISYNQMSANLMLGITNAFWPGITDVHYPDYTVPPVYNLGLALYCGKFYINDAYALDAGDTYQKGNITLLEYHLFGDPETPLWTETPETLTVEHPDYLCFGESIPVSITVYDESNTGIEGAKVCLHKQGEIFEVQDTNNDGAAIFNLEHFTCGELQITVTVQNYKPYTEEIEICPTDCYLILIWPLLILVIVIFFFWRKKK